MTHFRNSVSLPSVLATFTLIAHLFFLFFRWDLTYALGPSMVQAASDLQNGIIFKNDQLISSHFASHVVSLFPHLYFFLLKYLGLSYSTTSLFLTLLQNLFWTLGAYLIGKKLSGSPWGGFFGVVALFVGWANTACISYSITTKTPAFDGSFGIATGILVLGLWFCDKNFLALCLLALLIPIHIVNGVVISLTLFIENLVRVLKKEERVSKHLAGWTIVAVATFFTVLPILSEMKYNQSVPIDWSAWWVLMNMRKWFHVRPWYPVGNVISTFALSCLYALGLYLGRREGRISSETCRKAWTMLFVALAFLLLSLFGYEILRSPALVAPMFTKATIFLIPIASGLLFSLFAQNIRYVPFLFLFFLEIGHSGPSIYAAVVLLVVAVFFSRIGLEKKDSKNSSRALIVIFSLTWVAYFLSLLLINPVTPKLFQVAACAIILLLLTGLAAERIVKVRIDPFGFLKSSQARSIIFTLALVVVSKHVYGLYGNYQSHIQQEPKLRAERELKDWVVAHTPSNAVFIVSPTFTCAPHCLGREIVYSYIWMGISEYVQQGLEIEKTALSTLYGLNLLDPKSVEAFGSRPSAEMEKRYQTMTSADTDRILSVYPEVRYVLAERSRPELEFTPNISDLRIVYKNSYYQILACKH